MVEPALHVEHVHKTYGDFVAVDDLSFAVSPGEIFGLLGPNGAGKTTTIRMIMDIYRPDLGSIEVFGGAPDESRPRVGYLPEQSGLYREESAFDVLVYLAELKGRDREFARDSAAAWLQKVELDEWAEDEVQSLSRGMQQKLQVAASLVHEPDLVILDEPFQGLDPVNARLVRDIIRDIQTDGTTIILSSHQLNLVEALCDRIVLIHEGRDVLYGGVGEIKRRHSPAAFRLQTPDRVPDDLAGASTVEQRDGGYLVTLDGGDTQDFLRQLLEAGVTVEAFELTRLPLEDIFIRTVEGDDA